MRQHVPAGFRAGVRAEARNWAAEASPQAARKQNVGRERAQARGFSTHARPHGFCILGRIELEAPLALAVAEGRAETSEFDRFEWNGWHGMEPSELCLEAVEGIL